MRYVGSTRCPSAPARLPGRRRLTRGSDPPPCIPDRNTTRVVVGLRSASSARGGLIRHTCYDLAQVCYLRAWRRWRSVSRRSLLGVGVVRVLSAVLAIVRVRGTVTPPACPVGLSVRPASVTVSGGLWPDLCARVGNDPGGSSLWPLAVAAGVPARRLSWGMLRPACRRGNELASPPIQVAGFGHLANRPSLFFLNRRSCPAIAEKFLGFFGGLGLTCPAVRSIM